MRENAKATLYTADRQTTDNSKETESTDPFTDEDVTSVLDAAWDELTS